MKYIIVANGPFLPTDIIGELAQDATIIALDGACDKLAKIGILPKIILGDFDSIEENNIWGIKRFELIDDASPPYQGSYGTVIVPAKNQDKTDLIKAIRYCDINGATDIAIVCATGNRMDHTLGNIRTLRAEYRKERALKIYTESQMLTFAKNETITMIGDKGDYCGIMSFPDASFTSTGLTWDVSNYKLNFGLNDSTCNSVNNSPATISITGDALIIHPGPLRAQKALKDAEKSVGKNDFYKQVKEVCLAQEFILQVLQSKELQELRNIRKIIKKKLDMSKTEKPITIHYLSQKKQEVYHPSNATPVLTSLSPDKFNSHQYFRKFLEKNINEVSREKLLEDLPSQYQKKIPKASI